MNHYSKVPGQNMIWYSFESSCFSQMEHKYNFLGSDHLGAAFHMTIKAILYKQPIKPADKLKGQAICVQYIIKSLFEVVDMQ